MELFFTSTWGWFRQLVRKSKQRLKSTWGWLRLSVRKKEKKIKSNQRSTCGWLRRSVRTDEHSWSLSWSLESTTKINPCTWQGWWWDGGRWECCYGFAPHDSILAKCLWSSCYHRGHRLSHESLCTWSCQYTTGICIDTLLLPMPSRVTIIVSL